MNWETYQNYRSLHTKYIRYERNRQPRTAPATASESETSHHELSQPPLHPRRTLDQFYYSSLADTTVRDADQTISKWTGSHIDQEGRARAGNDSLLIMIDQLWCWVLDESKSPANAQSPSPLKLTLIGTILSCFPSHNHSYSQNGKFRDLYPSIQQNVDGCTTVWDMYSLLVKEAITYLFSQKNRGFTDLIETYRWVTGKKVMSVSFITLLVTERLNLDACRNRRLHTKQHISRNSTKTTPMESQALHSSMTALS
jgi:hypothetical protein